MGAIDVIKEVAGDFIASSAEGCGGAVIAVCDEVAAGHALGQGGVLEGVGRLADAGCARHGPVAVTREALVILVVITRGTSVVACLLADPHCGRDGVKVRIGSLTSLAVGVIETG